jgi:hypothetical protein
VNDDTGKAHQFLNSMTVDQTTGYIYVLFYDRRNELLPWETEVYLAVSRDGGLTFSNEKISQSPFRPVASYFFGDYTGIAATNGIVRPVWARMDGGQTSVWTAMIDMRKSDSALKIRGPQASRNRFDPVYPNPFRTFAQVPFTLGSASAVRLSVVDLFGRTLAVLEPGVIPAGANTLRFEPAGLGLVPGTYFLHLSAGGERVVRKVIYEGSN